MFPDIKLSNLSSRDFEQIASEIVAVDNVLSEVLSCQSFDPSQVKDLDLYQKELHRIHEDNVATFIDEVMSLSFVVDTQKDSLYEALFTRPSISIDELKRLNLSEIGCCGLSFRFNEGVQGEYVSGHSLKFLDINNRRFYPDPINGLGYQYRTSKQGYSYLYVGEFLRSKPTGKCHILREDGCTYVGRWENNQPQGAGIFTNTDGKIFTGEWMDGFLYKVDGNLIPQYRDTVDSLRVLDASF